MTRTEKISLGACLCLCLLVFAAGFLQYIEHQEEMEAYILVPEGMAMANFRYQDLPMRECAWCGRTVDLNRHHITPWAASPELKDEITNLVVLCRACHMSVAHGNNWKQFNANLVETLKTPVWKNSNEFYRETHGGKDRTEVRK